MELFFVFSLFALWQKSSSRDVFWKNFHLVSPAFLVRSTVCCRVLYDTRPSTGFPVFFQSSRRHPRPCRSSMLGAWLAHIMEVSSLDSACGPYSEFQAIFSAVRCSLVAGCAGMFPGMTRGLHDEIPPRRLLCCLSVFCYVCIF